MSQFSGNMRGVMCGETFIAGEFGEEQRLESYVGRDNYLSIIRNLDGTFSLRAHDEVTRGGLLLASPPASPKFDTGGLGVFTDIASLPVDFECGVSKAMLDLDLSGGSVNLNDYSPNLACGSIEIRFRKVDSSANTIRWTDHLGIEYNFVDKQGEFITLAYDKGTGQAVIV